MKKATAQILQVLRGRGYRISAARAQLVQALAEQSQPQRVTDLAAASIDQATIYRTLSWLQAEGLLEEFPRPDGTSAYSLIIEHHDHVRCVDCGRVAHIDCVNVPPPVRVHNFASIHGHELTYLGRCRQCAV